MHRPSYSGWCIVVLVRRNYLLRGLRVEHIHFIRSLTENLLQRKIFRSPVHAAEIRVVQYWVFLIIVQTFIVGIVFEIYGPSLRL